MPIKLAFKMDQDSGSRSLIFAAKHNIPVIYIASPMMGATAPATMAGCIAQANAESLSGLVIHQLVRSGAPRVKALDGVAEAHTIALACGDAPQGSNRWTVRLLPDQVLSHAKVVM